MITDSVLSEEQVRSFAQTGLVRLPQAFSSDDAARMQASVWQFLGRSGMVESDPTTWVPGAVVGVSPRLKRRPVMQLGWSDQVTSAVTRLLGTEWDLPTHCGQVMVTMPDPSQPWRVPHHIWHPDYSLAHEPEPLFGIKTFAFISSVVPEGGGTCVIEGSHQLLARFLQALPLEIRADPMRNVLGRFMRSDPWLNDLRTHGEADRGMRFMVPTVIDDCELKVAELTGEPGDVVLCHPWLLHCAARNGADRPRMMTTKNIYRRGVALLASHGT